MESENLVFLVLPKDLKLGDPRLKTSVVETKQGFRVKLSAEQPALWAWLSLEGCDAKYSENFVHVKADAPAQIIVRPERGMSETQFTEALRVRSLYDTYST